MRKKPFKIKAFTLIELMISVLIIAVLAAIAVPAYFKHVEKARGSKALVTLNQIRSAAELYAVSASEYTNDLTVLQTYSAFSIIDPDWSYSLDVPTNSTFIATATRTIPQRPDYDGKTITIDQKSEIIVNGDVNGTWPD